MKVRLKAPAALKNPYVLAGVAAAAVLGMWFLFGQGAPEEKLFTVEASEFVQEVSLSGKVVAAQSADLAFSQTDRVVSVGVAVGDKVAAGQVLASQTTDILRADLRAAQSDLAEIKNEQNTLVESARRTLNSSGLAAVPNSSSYDATAPTISGLYRGDEGSYRIRVERGIVSSIYNIFVSGLERPGPVEILDDEPTPVGSQGLYLTFPDAQSAYANTTWIITIPNTKSSSYLANKNAYDEALRTRDRAIASAEEAVRSIEATLAERILRAPFAGTITMVEAKAGSVAYVNEPAIAMISAGALEIESYVPEINLSFVQVGAPAIVTLDAYGEDAAFEARVASIDPAETVRDGVSTYRAILTFTKQDPRIRSGLTANIKITADRRDAILQIPQNLVTEQGGRTVVLVKEGKDIREREVMVGARSSQGTVEILSGLVAGDTVVAP